MFRAGPPGTGAGVSRRLHRVMPSSTTCWARGRVMYRTDLRIEPAERAFRYGDGVFATIRILDGALLDAADHLARLSLSAAAVGLPVPGPVRGPLDLVQVLRQLGAGHAAEGVVRVQVSAGPGGRGFGRPEAGDDFREDVSGAWELVEVLPPPVGRRLTVAILADEEVPVPPLPSVKSCSALPYVLCAAAAARRGVAEAIRVGGGLALEAAAANLFWATDGALHTPSVTLPVYPGVTRSLVIEVARREGWDVREGRYPVVDLNAADAAFLTNATRGLEPIAEIDGKAMAWPSRLETLRREVESARRRAGLSVADPIGRPADPGGTASLS